MTNADSREPIEDYFELIDQTLSEAGVPLTQRPFSAAISFVTTFVEEVVDGGKSQSPTEECEFLEERWFGKLYKGR